MKIKTKLTFNMWFSLASIVFVYIVMVYGAHKTKQYEDLSIEVLHINHTLTDMRLEEKDLYAPGDTSQALAFYEEKVAKIDDFLQDLHERLDNNKKIRDEIDDLEHEIKTYEAAVKKTYDLLKVQIGSVGDGALKDAAVNDYIYLQKNLTGTAKIILLEIFQDEVLYERTLDSFFLDKWKKDINRLYKILPSNARPYLLRYRNTYQEMAAIFKQIGVSDEEGLRKIKIEAIDNVGEEVEHLFHEIEQYGEKKLSNLELMVACFILGAIINIVILSTLIQRVILNSIDVVSEIINTIEKEKNMTLRVKLKVEDEMGFIGGKLNNMMVALQDTLIEVSSTIDVILKSCTKLNTSIEVSASDMQKQLLQTDMVATAATEMVSTINEISSNTVKMSNLSRKSNEVAVQGQEDVKKVVTLINKLAENLHAASDDVQQLAQDSVSIGNVLNVISEIAEQTNLLALNAAIEAARAGEQGRGFAVVADEVRGLAGKTQEATTEISTIIEKLQASTDNIVEVVVQGQKESVACSEQSENTGKILQEIAHSVTLLSDMSTTVAAAVEEQSAVSSEIGENMVTIRDLANSSNDMSQQNAKSTQELQAKANELFGKISAFKL